MKNVPFIVAIPIGVILSVSCVSMWQKINHLQTELIDLRENTASQRDISERKVERLLSARLQKPSTKILGNQDDICTKGLNNSTEHFLGEVAQNNAAEAVLTKYHMMLNALEVGVSEEQELIALLAKREGLINIVSHSYFTDPMDSEVTLLERDEKLSEIDNQVDHILDQAQRDKYRLLRDSGFEQFQIREFDDSLEASEVLTDQQSNSLLLAKLRAKEEYLRAIKDATKLIDMGEQEEGFKSYDMAIESYQRQYLEAAHDELTDIQFSKLTEIEGKNFEDMLYSLKAPYEDRDWEDD